MRRAALVALVGCTAPLEDTALVLPDGACEPSGAPAVPLRLLAADAGQDGARGVVTDEEGWTLVTERAVGEGIDLAQWRSTDGGVTWSDLGTLDLVDDVYVGNPSTVVLGGEQWLYFQSAHALTAVPLLWRSRYGPSGFEAVEPVRPLIDARDWDARPIAWSDGGAVWVAYNGPDQRPSLAVAIDGVGFVGVGAPTMEPQDSFVVGTFGDGTVLAVWQSGDGAALLSRSEDGGASWSTPRNVSSAFDAARDVRLVFVERARVDIYYTVRVGDDVAVRRRPVFADGGASVEEPIAVPGLVGASAPVAHRLPDCRVLVTVATEADGPLGVVVLPGDAEE